jgi:hypothetical protein
VYSDIDGLWTGQDSTTIINFNTSSDTSIYQLTVGGATEFQELNDMALWGTAIYASRPCNASKLSAAGGPLSSVRSQFVRNGKLDGSQQRWKSGSVTGFAHDLGIASVAKCATFAIGYTRDNAVNYLGSGRASYYRSKYKDSVSAVVAFLDDYQNALADSHTLDMNIKSRSITAAGQNYSDIVTLSTRQTMGSIDITIPGDSLNASDIMVFMKEISSDGNVNTLDVSPFTSAAIPSSFHLC